MLYKIYSKIKGLIWQSLKRLKDESKGVCAMGGKQGKNNGAVVVGALILGFLLLKSIVDRQTQIYRCPTCGLVIQKNTQTCPRCYTELNWLGVP